MVGALERLCDGREPPRTDLHLDFGVVSQVQRPQCALARGDQDRTIGLVDIADRDRSRKSAAPTTGRESGDRAREEQIAADVVRQRARCQDLPSVWVDGA